MATTPLAVGFRLFSAEIPLLEDAGTGKVTLVYRADTPTGVFERRYLVDFVQGDDMAALVTSQMSTFQSDAATAGFAIT